MDTMRLDNDDEDDGYFLDDDYEDTITLVTT